jgi:hypothetical protein
MAEPTVDPVEEGHRRRVDIVADGPRGRRDRTQRAVWHKIKIERAEAAGTLRRDVSVRVHHAHRCTAQVTRRVCRIGLGDARGGDGAAFYRPDQFLAGIPDGVLLRSLLDKLPDQLVQVVAELSAVVLADGPPKLGVGHRLLAAVPDGEPPVEHSGDRQSNLVSDHSERVLRRPAIRLDDGIRLLLCGSPAAVVDAGVVRHTNPWTVPVYKYGSAGHCRAGTVRKG